MDIRFQITPTYTTSVGGTDTNQQVNNTPKSDRTLTITLTPGDGTPENNGIGSIQLSYPLIGPEDINLNEFIQQLENMDPTTLKGMTATAAALLVNQMAMDLAESINTGGLEFVKSNGPKIEEALKQIEDQASDTMDKLLDAMNNSNYPDFNEFLSEMLSFAQKLRQDASAARQSMIMGEYNNLLDQSKVMMDTAKKNYDAAMKEIEASRTQAIGKIVSGAVSLLATGIGAMGGGFAGAQFGAQVGGMTGNIIDGSFGLAASQDQMIAAGYKKDAEENQALLKKYEAAQKLLQEAQNVLQELRDIAKTLSDAILKLYQDFTQNQSQIVQRSNI